MSIVTETHCIIYSSILDIIVENIGINTEYCFDSNGSDEFKCECNEGFDGKRCEDECSLDCGIHGRCTTEIDITTGIKQWKCLCNNNFTGFIHGHQHEIESLWDKMIRITLLRRSMQSMSHSFRWWKMWRTCCVWWKSMS